MGRILRGPRTNLSVAFADKDKVKSLGAWWDPVDRVWYIYGDNLEPFRRWVIEEHQQSCQASTERGASCDCRASGKGSVEVDERAKSLVIKIPTRFRGDELFTFDGYFRDSSFRDSHEWARARQLWLRNRLEVTWVAGRHAYVVPIASFEHDFYLLCYLKSFFKCSELVCSPSARRLLEGPLDRSILGAPTPRHAELSGGSSAFALERLKDEAGKLRWFTGRPVVFMEWFYNHWVSEDYGPGDECGYYTSGSHHPKGNCAIHVRPIWRVGDMFLEGEGYYDMLTQCQGCSGYHEAQGDFGLDERGLPVLVWLDGSKPQQWRQLMMTYEKMGYRASIATCPDGQRWRPRKLRRDPFIANGVVERRP
ncbi:MAG: DUF5710 domain-containing protein [Candidatus Dormibacteria bacterium]